MPRFHDPVGLERKRQEAASQEIVLARFHLLRRERPLLRRLEQVDVDSRGVRKESIASLVRFPRNDCSEKQTAAALYLFCARKRRDEEGRRDALFADSLPACRRSTESRRRDASAETAWG